MTPRLVWCILPAPGDGNAHRSCAFSSSVINGIASLASQRGRLLATHSYGHHSSLGAPTEPRAGSRSEIMATSRRVLLSYQPSQKERREAVRVLSLRRSYYQGM